MKIWVLISTFFLLFSCNQLIDQPKNLVAKDKMATVIAELAIADQMPVSGQLGDLEVETRLILKKNQVNAKDFSNSFKYYISTDELNGIADQAEDIVKAKNPKAKEYIEKKLKENKVVPTNLK